MKWPWCDHMKCSVTVSNGTVRRPHYWHNGFTERGFTAYHHSLDNAFTFLNGWFSTDSHLFGLLQYCSIIIKYITKAEDCCCPCTWTRGVQHPLCAMSIPAIGTVLLFSCTIMTVKTVQFNMNYLWIHCDTYEAPTKSILIHTYFSFISRIKKSCKKWPLLRCTQTLSRTSGATRVLQVLYGKQSDPLPENNQKAETNTHAHPGSAEPVFMHAAPMVCITQASSSIGASKRPAEISVHLV